MKKLPQLLAVVVTLLLGYAWGRLSAPSISLPTETIITKTDTIRDTVPVPKDSIIVKWRTVKLPTAPSTDTVYLAHTDSVEVQVPITQKEYQDSTYHAWVSGFEPSLDSIHVYSRTTTITKTTPVYIKKRWGIGVQVGVGVTNNKVSPYIGIGVSYNLWNF